MVGKKKIETGRAWETRSVKHPPYPSIGREKSTVTLRELANKELAVGLCRSFERWVLID